MADPLRWFDVRDGSRGEHSSLPAFAYYKDPLGDTAVLYDPAREDLDLRFVDLQTGAELGVATLPGAFGTLLAWVRRDAVVVSYASDGDDTRGRASVFSDGRVVVHEPARLWVYAGLPGDDVLFSEDGGQTIEQGRIDWEVPRIVSSIPRPDLAAYSGRFSAGFERGSHYVWTPALDGVLIHVVPGGPLRLAGL